MNAEKQANLDRILANRQARAASSSTARVEPSPNPTPSGLVTSPMYGTTTATTTRTTQQQQKASLSTPSSSYYGYQAAPPVATAAAPQDQQYTTTTSSSQYAAAPPQQQEIASPAAKPPPPMTKPPPTPQHNQPQQQQDPNSNFMNRVNSAMGRGGGGTTGGMSASSYGARYNGGNNNNNNNNGQQPPGGADSVEADRVPRGLIPQTSTTSDTFGRQEVSQHSFASQPDSTPAVGGGGGGQIQPYQAPEQRNETNLFQKGTFDNFRNKPLYVSANVKSYLRPEDANSSSAPRQRSASQHRDLQAKQASPPKPKKLTERNPFRQQGYDDFAVAPSYAVPRDVSSALEWEDAHHAHEGSITHALAAQAKQQADPRQGAPVFDLQQCLQALEKGDWFLKWTRRKDKVHRRYFWIDVQRSVLFWAKTPDAFSYLSSSVRIEDICSLEAQCVVDDASGKTLYLLVIVCTTRHIQIGTEQRDKFDVWFDTLQRLTDTVRAYNAKYYQRYAGAKYQGQTAMTNRAQQRRQEHSSAD